MKPSFLRPSPIGRIKTLFLPDLKKIEWPDADRHAVVIDRHVHQRWYAALRPFLPEHALMIRRSTEAAKRFRSLERLFSFFVRNGLGRDSLVIGIGGGALTDAVGLAASLYKRGIRTLWMPTTILAMVDAAIGGKTAVNFQHLKNIIGTYHFPEQILIVPEFIRTLSPRQRLSGIGEIFKHALIEGGPLWQAVEKGRLHPSLPLTQWAPILSRAAAVKTAVVRRDPYEKNRRKVLNVGHTIGHAIEGYASARRRAVPHGLAVAWGILWESRLSHALGRMPRPVLDQVSNLLQRLFPPCPADIHPADLLPWMLHDKKNRHRAIGFALVERPGKVDPEVLLPPETVIKHLRQSVPR